MASSLHNDNSTTLPLPQVKCFLMHSAERKESEVRIWFQVMANRGRCMRLTEKMPAGRVYQVSARMSARIYPRSEREPRLAFFGEDYVPSPVSHDLEQNTGAGWGNLNIYVVKYGEYVYNNDDISTFRQTTMHYELLGG